MKIYFVETNANNELIAVENGKAKAVDAPKGIDIEETNGEGTQQTEKIIANLKQYFAATLLNDYDNIYSENEFRWNPDEFQNVIQVY